MTPDSVLGIVVFSLLLDFLNNRVRGVERVLCPIVFVGLSRCRNWLWRRSGACRFLLGALLEKEESAADASDD